MREDKRSYLTVGGQAVNEFSTIASETVTSVTVTALAVTSVTVDVETVPEEHPLSVPFFQHPGYL